MRSTPSNARRTPPGLASHLTSEDVKLMRKIRGHLLSVRRSFDRRCRGCNSGSGSAPPGPEGHENPAERGTSHASFWPGSAAGLRADPTKADIPMERDNDELDRMVLTAVSNDFESFESIVSRISGWNGGTLAERDTERIGWSLVRSIASNYIRAYLVHADAPYITVVGDSSDTIRRYWFYITASGLQYLRDGHHHCDADPES